ncbi:hypothetical protein C7N43_21610 [Sphingobacteriales bacterium UPWRP_1]|nr:hypothetical protein C7N43_21610 [Sphingobacteriales bacterium UPWRP_1]
MKKGILSTLTLAFVLVAMVACNQAEGDKAAGNASPADAKTGTAVDATANTANPATPAEGEVDPNLPKTTVEFAQMEHDFGKINEGDKVSHVFKFKNTGKEPLIIASAKGSCGCTVPEYPKEPIAPGAESQILVEFNSKGKKNMQTKTVTINANTDPNPMRLTIKADVTPAPGSENEAANPAQGGQLKVNPPAPAGKK